MKLFVKNQIGSRCITQEDGQRLFEAIQIVLRSNEQVTLDFNGVNQFASPFFNFAIGQLLNERTETDLQRLLKVEHLNKSGTSILERVIQNATRYHKDKDYKKIVDEIIEAQAKEID